MTAKKAARPIPPPSHLIREDETQPQPAPDQASDDQGQNDLVLAAMSLFEDGGSEFETSIGKTVSIKPAKTKQIGTVMKFFADVAGALQGSELMRIIDVIAEKQHHLAAAGGNPRKIDLKAILAEDGAEAGLNNVALISLLFQAVFEHLPGFVAAFTNLENEEFGELNPDESMLVVFGIFAVNYDFFIQRVLPLLVGFLQSLAREKEKRNQIVANQKKKLTR